MAGAVIPNPTISRLKCLSPKFTPFFSTINFITSTTNSISLHHQHLSRRLLTCSASFQDQFPVELNTSSSEQDEEEEEEESYGEVNRIIGSRTVPVPNVDDDPNIPPFTTEFLIEWKDGHEPSWVPSTGIAADVIAEYETPWWNAAKKPDDAALSALLSDPSITRDPDALDQDGRTALHFVAGLGSEAAVRVLVEVGADVDRKEKSGRALTPLHMAAGYARPGAVKALLELGADPEAVDVRGRTAMELAKEVLAATPKANPAAFTRRLALESVIRELEAAVYEYAEVEQILEGRGEGDKREYLVEWKDGDRGWVKAKWIGEDLISDFEAGLEYAVAEAVIGMRMVEEDGKEKREFMVKWVDIEDTTWEPEENVDPELIHMFEKKHLPEQQQQQQHETGFQQENATAVGSPT